MYMNRELMNLLNALFAVIQHFLLISSNAKNVQMGLCVKEGIRFRLKKGFGDWKKMKWRIYWVVIIIQKIVLEELGFLMNFVVKVT